MIDDIIYTPNEFILELPLGATGGDITSYSFDGSNYDFISNGGTSSSEHSHVFIN
jgi:hypothetical protein